MYAPVAALELEGCGGAVVHKVEDVRVRIIVIERPTGHQSGGGVIVRERGSGEEQRGRGCYEARVDERLRRGRIRHAQFWCAEEHQAGSKIVGAVIRAGSIKIDASGHVIERLGVTSIDGATVNAVRLLCQRNLHALDEFSFACTVLEELQLEGGVRAIVSEKQGTRIAVSVSQCHARPGDGPLGTSHIRQRGIGEEQYAIGRNCAALPSECRQRRFRRCHAALDGDIPRTGADHGFGGEPDRRRDILRHGDDGGVGDGCGVAYTGHGSRRSGGGIVEITCTGSEDIRLSGSADGQRHDERENLQHDGIREDSDFHSHPFF